MFISLKSVKGFSSGRGNYHKSAFHTFLHSWRTTKRRRSVAWTTDDQPTSFIYVVNDREVHTVHRERISLCS
jgi:hypothetical protein